MRWKLLLTLLLANTAWATSMPTGNTYCVWRPMAPNASDNVSGYFEQVMDEWGYTSTGNRYIETTYGWVEGTIYGLVVHEPAECTVGAFLSEIAQNHSALFFASHAFLHDMVISTYTDQASAEYAASWLGAIHGVTLEAVPVQPAPLWGIKISASQVTCNAKIIVDMGCYNFFRKDAWGSPLTFLGHNQSELGPGELTPQLTNFFGKMRFDYYPTDEDYIDFPTDFKHSFAEADALVDTLTVYHDGDVVLGPTFVPWDRKHDERDGPGVLDVVFDTNVPCTGSYSISSFNSGVATVVGNGVNGDGDLYVQLDITGAGISALICDSHWLYASANSLISFNGGNGFLVQFTVDTTPNAGIEDFSVSGGTGRILVSSLINTRALIIEGSDSVVGPYIELARLERQDLQVGEVSVGGLTKHRYYRLREEEATGGYINHVVVEPRQDSGAATTTYDSKLAVRTHLDRMVLEEKALSSNRLAILAPSFMANAVSAYHDFWSHYLAGVDVYWIDGFWDGGTDPDVFRMNEKAFIADLIAQGHDTFLLVGDASDSKEIQSPWPTEYGWEDYRLELLAGTYIPQPEKNIHPSPVYWYDPVLSQDAGVSLPYFFSDWLLLDLDGDDFPDPGLVIGRLPFSDEGQLWTYLNKIVELRRYGLSEVPINTLALVGDVNHAGEFDGVHAVDVMGSHLDAIEWPIFTMLESEYGSELSRAGALRTAWQDPAQMWNFVVCVASYSTRYRLGNWVTLAFNLDFVPEMTHYPFMFLNSCTTGNYWWTENGGTPPRVEYLLEKHAGASGVFAHSDGSWQEPNRSLGVAFLDLVRDNSGQSWGVSASRSVQASKDLGTRERINALRSVFLSDPVIEPLAFNPEPTVPTGVAEDTPATTRVTGNVPNPFNPSTVISYEVGGNGGKVNLTIYDIRGSRVRELVSEHQSAGDHRVLWDGTDDNGRNVASGWYACRLTVGDVVATTKMALVR